MSFFLLSVSLCRLSTSPRPYLIDVIQQSLISYGKTRPACTTSTEHSCGSALSPQNLQSGHRSALPFAQDCSSRITWVQLQVVHTNQSDDTQKNANRLVFVFLLQTGKLYTLSILRTLNAKVKLRERMKSDDFARGSLGNWSWRQADSGVDREMSMSAAVSELRFGVCICG